MFTSRIPYRSKCSSKGVLAGAAVVMGFALVPSELCAQYVPPAGYTKTELIGPGNQPISVNGFGVSSGGRFAVASGSTITLYDTWKNGRSVIGSITDKTDWGFLTDISFVNENEIVFGENSKTNTAWSVDFSNPSTPVAASIAPANSFPAIQGVAVVNSSTALLTGTTASFGNSGGLYLDKLNLGTGAATPIVSNTGSGFVGGPGLTGAGNSVLLDSGTTLPDFTSIGIAHVYDGASGNFIHDVNLANGGGTGAYGIAFDPAGNGYVTTGATLTKISGIDSANPIVSSFGFFSEGPAGFPFPSGIAFTGGSFFPDDAIQTGALLINGAFTNDGTIFAITSVPEPTSALLVLSVGLVVIGGRSRRIGGLS